MLTLDESIFLASIVPSPKNFAWRFDDTGELKSYAKKHNNYVKNIMLRRGLIMPEDTIAQSGNIRVTGRARSRMRINEGKIFLKDTTAVKKLFLDLSKRAF
jgi:membrane peptidoglycan carboxypeptidase